MDATPADVKTANVTPFSAVTFSGGGFRAMLFHLGVLLWLRKHGRIDRTTRFYGVSGGAVLAGHLGLHFDSYFAGDDELRKCLSSLMSLVSGDLRNRVMRRWLYFYALMVIFFLSMGMTLWMWRLGTAASGWMTTWLIFSFFSLVIFLLAFALAWISPSRTRLLESQYTRFLFPLMAFPERRPPTVLRALQSVGRRIRALLPQRAARNRMGPTRGGSPLGLAVGDVPASTVRFPTLRDLPPNVWLAATSLTTGELVAFSKDTIAIYNSNYQPSIPSAYNPRYFLSRAVCCSSAFPPAFEPVPLTKREMGNINQARDHAVTDGGVYDNLGVQLLRATLAPVTGPRHLVLVSDAGRPLAYENDAYRHMLGRNIRANDLEMYRLADHDFSSIQQTGNYELKSCRIYAPRHHKELPDPMQAFAAQIRTDLDAFRDYEIYVLVKHGAAAARLEIDENLDELKENEICSLCGLRRSRVELEDAFMSHYSPDGPVKQFFMRQSLAHILRELAKIIFAWDTVATLSIICVLFLSLVPATYWDLTRAVVPAIDSGCWQDASDPTPSDSILVALLEQLGRPPRSPTDHSLSILATNVDLGILAGNHVPAAFRLNVPYESVADHKCWLVLESDNAPDASGMSTRTYREVASTASKDHFFFDIDRRNRGDRLLLIVPRLDDSRLKRLKETITLTKF